MEEHAGPSKRVYVGNLAYSVTWQDLKDFMREIGEVVYADVLTEYGSRRSKGCGIVEFANPEDAARSIATMTDRELHGRPIFVREDREPNRPARPARPFRGAPRDRFAPFPRGPRGGGKFETKGFPVVVSGLPEGVTWRDLRSVFGACGQIERADIMYTGSGVPMDRGIVYFETEAQAKDAVLKFNGYSFNGHIISVKFENDAQTKSM